MLTCVVLSAVAAFERGMLRERVRSGLRNAKLRGKRLGRPSLRQLTPEVIAQLHNFEMIEDESRCRSENSQINLDAQLGRHTSSVGVAVNPMLGH